MPKKIDNIDRDSFTKTEKMIMRDQMALLQNYSDLAVKIFTTKNFEEMEIGELYDLLCQIESASIQVQDVIRGEN